MAAEPGPVASWGAALVAPPAPWPVQLLRRWRVQAHLDLLFMTRDVGFFTLCVVSDLVHSVAGVVAVFLLAERFDGVGLWSHDQICFLLGYATLVRALLDMGFGYNVLAISRRVGRGQLDHVLIQPQPVWMTLLTEGFTPFVGLSPVLAGAGFTGWALARLGWPADPLWWCLLALHLLSSAAVVLAFSFLWGSLAFWSPVGAEEISSRAMGLMQLKSFPLDGVGPLLSQVLLSVVPVGFVAWYPCRALLGLGGTTWATPLFAAVLVGIAAAAFRRGLRHYERTGSQRYLRWGHRG